VIHSAFELLSHSPEAYLIVFALALGDAVFPVLPSETALITGGLLSVNGHISVHWVILAGAVGAIAGDSIAYALGRFSAHFARERLLRGKRTERALRWAKGQFDERGGLVIVVARYIPGGRTAVTFTAGLTHYSYPRFLLFDACSAAVWATYGTMLGYLGGRFFRSHEWIGLLVAFGVAMLVAGAVEAVRRVRA
jgi:membrane protein DedA with SNARE-associated domain